MPVGLIIGIDKKGQNTKGKGKSARDEGALTPAPRDSPSRATAGVS